jgi:GT2 family glycosyltransferase
VTERLDASIPNWADVVVLAASGTIAAPGAVEALTAALASADADVVTCDHAVRLPNPLAFHKPATSPLLLASGPYVGPVVAIRASMLEGLDDPRDIHLSLVQICQTASLQHIDRVWFAVEEGFGFPASEQAGRHVMERHHRVDVESTAKHRWLRFQLVPQRPEPITVIIPTLDGGSRLGRLLEAVLDSEHPAKAIVMDNDSTDPGTRSALDEAARGSGVTVVRSPGPFNFSNTCNRALSMVDTATVAFLNDDIEALDNLWLGQLVANLDDPAVGAVGPLLTFPDGRIQHSGVVLGLGGAAGNAFRGAPVGNDGYLGLASARREVSAVTGACLIARTADLRAIGGFDSTYRIDFQDVDLCLRLRKRLGLTTVVDPRRPLVHFESATRGPAPANSEDAGRLQQQFGGVIESDPFYSDRLSRQNPGYVGDSARTN